MNRQSVLNQVRKIDEEKHSVSAYVSNFEWDRYGTKFLKGAYRTQNYMKNPVVLWSHNMEFVNPQGGVPIGKTVDLVEDDKGLRADMIFDSENDFSMQVFGAMKRGFLNAFSIGFRVFKSESEQISEGSDERGRVFVDVELLDVSVVPIPGNPGTVLERGDADIITRVFGANHIKTQNDKMIFIQPEKDPNVQLDASLRSLIDLAKIVKRDNLDEQRLILVTSTISTLSEILSENTPGVSKTEFESLNRAVQELGNAVKENVPDIQDMVSKAMMQIDVAIRGNRRK
jgi:HK97 family phage prohead protease